MGHWKEEVKRRERGGSGEWVEKVVHKTVRRGVGDARAWCRPVLRAVSSQLVRSLVGKSRSVEVEPPAFAKGGRLSFIVVLLCAALTVFLKLYFLISARNYNVCPPQLGALGS